jgi:hypothetical protein
MKQIDRIEQLEKQLEDAKKHTYVCETNSLHCTDGELHISYGNYPEDERYLVMDVEQLFKDLPFIISQVCKEQKKTQEMHLEMIKDSIHKL